MTLALMAVDTYPYSTVAHGKQLD